MDKIRRILMPKLIQNTHTRHVTNEGYTFITRTKQQNKFPIRRFKRENIYNTILPMQNGVSKKPFSRGGPYRIGMAKYCQIAKRNKEPLTTYYYPVYPGMEKIPLSTYVTNWRWYIQSKEVPARQTIDSRIREIGMNDYLQATKKSRSQEIQKALPDNPIVANLPSRTRRKYIYRE